MKAAPRIAICYFGMTRSTRHVYKSHHDNIFQVLREHGAHYDVFLHTWRAEQNLRWWMDTGIPHDYEEHKFLNPAHYQIDDQKEFLDSVRFEDYFYEDVAARGNQEEWHPQLIKNHLCALESLRRCGEMCRAAAAASGQPYDYVIVVRPDVRIHQKFPYEDVFRDFTENTVVIPRNDWNEGYNDRFAVVSFSNMEPLFNRICEIGEFRRNMGRIVSEKYTKYIMDKYYKVRAVDFRFGIIAPSGNAC